jgi:hypothetical protein
MNVAGWHVYLGTGPEDVVQQTVTPMAPDGIWVCPGLPVMDGSRTGKGQEATYYRKLPQMFLRG